MTKIARIEHDMVNNKRPRDLYTQLALNSAGVRYIAIHKVTWKKVTLDKGNVETCNTKEVSITHKHMYIVL